MSSGGQTPPSPDAIRESDQRLARRARTASASSRSVGTVSDQARQAAGMLWAPVGGFPPTPAPPPPPGGGRCARTRALPPADEVALDHHAGDRAAAGPDLSRDVARHVWLPRRIL